MPSALWFLALAMLVIRSAEVFYVPIMPLYARLLDTAAPLFVVGLATSVDRLGAVVITPVAGRWADRVGRRRPYLIGVGVTAVASVLAALPGVADLVAYRLVSGIGYGTLTTSEQLGIFVGPALAGASIAALDFTVALVGAGVVMVVGGLLFLLLVRESPLLRERVACGDRKQLARS